MSYCRSCGANLIEDAVFCVKCGTKVNLGSSVSSPSEEVREAFARASMEMEKAFKLASKELHEAFQTARSNMEKSIHKEPLNCPNCGEKNSSAAAYCVKCGNKLSIAENPKQ